MTRKILTTCLVWALSPTVLAGVQLWSGEPNDVSINGDDVIITAPGTFKFQSVTDDELDVIGSITVADGVTGTVTIHVRRNPNDMAGDDGATHVGAINLTNNQGDNLIGNLAELRITGNLGTAGPSVVRGITGDMSLGDIENDLTVNDDVGAGVTIGVNDVSGNITINDRLIGDIGSAVAPAGDITGTITVGGLAFGDIYANSLGDVSFATGTASSYNGKVVVATEYSGTFSVNAQPVGNALIFQGDMSGSISCRSVSGRVVVQGALTGPVELSQNLTGRIVVRGDLTPPGRIEILGDVLDDPNAPIRIRGSLTTGGGASDALIKVGDNPSQDSLSGTLAVDGSLTNANSSGEEIYVASFDTLGAVAINYDGDPGEGDEWASGATVVVDGNTYDGTDGNNTTDRVWNVSPCKGDMNGDGSVETTGDGDPGPNSGPFFQSAATYRNNFPGLEGSRDWHGDCSFNGVFDNTANGADEVAFANLLSEGCCLTSLVASCPWDLNNDLVTDISDLSILLSNFGTTSGATREDGDVEGGSGCGGTDGDVDLLDLSCLLANFGAVCCPEEEEPPTGDVTISIDAYDTSAYSGGGFEGEDEHFVFDVLIEVEEEDDDWTAAGVCLTRTNGAVFYLVDDPGNPPVPGNSEPEKYSTFFSVPKGVNNSSRFTNPFPTGGIAGGCHPLAPDFTYTTTSVHAAWLDWDVESNDGPAAILRVTIDVSAVSGADTSGGLGSVYYSTSGPNDIADIKVADLALDVMHKYAGATATEDGGSFYVVGE